MSGRSGIEAYLHLLAEAFRGLDAQEGHQSTALLPNIASVPESAWHALPSGSARSIESIAIHVGACKIMYDDYAFGGGRLRFATPEVEPFVEGEAARSEVVPWLERAHDRLAGHVAALAGDAELDRPRLTNWGEHRSTRWIVTTMINHDTYHAGEINHLRSMLGDDDRWLHIQLGYG